jgi:CarD family transcriptional regulator
MANDTLVLVPSSNAEEIGIRKPIAEESIQDIFDFIRNGGVDVTMNWKGRYKEHVDLMKSGTIQDMALVLKSLYYLQLIKPLSFREKKMMEKAKELLVTEISEVSCSPFEEIEVQVLEMLSHCFEDGATRVDS